MAIGVREDQGGRRHYKDRRAVDLFPYLLVGFYGYRGGRQESVGEGTGGRSL